MFNSIVVAYDGSEHAGKALEVAAGLAVSEQAPLGLIYVIDAGHASLSSELRDMGEVEHIIDSMPKLMVDLRQSPDELANNLVKSSYAAQQATLQFADYLVTAAARHAREYGVQDVDAKTASGDPAEKVVEYARGRNADLIVCGSRGMGRVKQLLLGSTSHKITQLADCSCLTIK